MVQITFLIKVVLALAVLLSLQHLATFWHSSTNFSPLSGQNEDLRAAAGDIFSLRNNKNDKDIDRSDRDSKIARLSNDKSFARQEAATIGRSNSRDGPDRDIRTGSIENTITQMDNPIREMKHEPSYITKREKEREIVAHEPLTLSEPASPARSRVAAMPQVVGSEFLTHKDPDSYPLLSEGKPVTASVRGNLGPPSVITSERVEDWLKDRWQAAANMQGEPIPGQHWVEIDLLTPAKVFSVLIDWEAAHSKDWVVRGRLTREEKFKVIFRSDQLKLVMDNKQHIIHTVESTEGLTGPYRYVRLDIRSPSTQWGSSIWRMQVNGMPT